MVSCFKDIRRQKNVGVLNQKSKTWTPTFGARQRTSHGHSSSHRYLLLVTVLFEGEVWVSCFKERYNFFVARKNVGVLNQRRSVGVRFKRQGWDMPGYGVLLR